MSMSTPSDARRSPQPDAAADRRCSTSSRRRSRRWRSASGSSRSRSTRSSARWRRTTISAGCRCRRRAACCSIATARSSSTTRTASTSRSSASRRKNLDETLHILALATGTDEAQLRETVDRRRREPSYRPIVLIENATLEQVIAVRARQWELPGHHLRRKCRRGNIPGSEHGGAPVRLRRRDHAKRSCSAPNTTGVEPGSIVGQAGIELAYNKLLMGTDGNKTVVVNSVGREIGDARTKSRRRRAAGCS